MKYWLMLSMLSCLVCGCSKSGDAKPASSAGTPAVSGKEMSTDQANTYKATMHQMHPDDPKYK